MRVTTFNDEEIEKLIAQSPKLLQEYIIALKNSAKTWERLTQEAIKKLRDDTQSYDIFLKKLRRLSY